MGEDRKPLDVPDLLPPGPQRTVRGADLHGLEVVLSDPPPGVSAARREYSAAPLVRVLRTGATGTTGSTPTTPKRHKGARRHDGGRHSDWERPKLPLSGTRSPPVDPGVGMTQNGRGSPGPGSKRSTEPLSGRRAWVRRREAPGVSRQGRRMPTRRTDDSLRIPVEGYPTPCKEKETFVQSIVCTHVSSQAPPRPSTTRGGPSVGDRSGNQNTEVLGVTSRVGRPGTDQGSASYARVLGSPAGTRQNDPDIRE